MPGEKLSPLRIFTQWMDLTTKEGGGDEDFDEGLGLRNRNKKRRREK